MPMRWGFDMIEPRTVPVEFKEVGVVNPLIVEIDKDIVNIVKAMNRFPGIRTVESCSGHGKQPVSIFFVPKTIEALPPLLYYFDWCHSGVTTWPVYITTDCSAHRVTWVVESEEVGPAAYIEGNTIAKVMLKDSLICGDD